MTKKIMTPTKVHLHVFNWQLFAQRHVSHKYNPSLHGRAVKSYLLSLTVGCQGWSLYLLMLDSWPDTTYILPLPWQNLTRKIVCETLTLQPTFEGHQPCLIEGPCY